MKEYNDIGDLYRDKFSGYEQEPPAQVWNRIEASTKKWSTKGKAAISAAVVTVVAIAVYFMLNTSSPKEDIVTIQSNESIIVEISQSSNWVEVESEKTIEFSFTEPKENVQEPKNELKESNYSALNISVIDNPSQENNHNEAVISPVSQKEESNVNSVETEPINSTTNVGANNYSPLSPVLISKDTTVCENSTVRLYISHAKNVRWSTGETSDVIYVNPSSDEQYNVTFTTASGRDTTATIDVKAVRCSEMFIPTAFTPNGDGLNEVFSAQSDGEYPYFEMTIYSANGKRLFTSKDIKHGWDGTYKGALQPHGVYTYVIRYKDAFGKMNEKKNNFSLRLY